MEPPPYADATFGGYRFVRQGEFVLLGHQPATVVPGGSVQFFGTTALPLDEAFLLRLVRGWRFVAGPARGQPNWWRWAIDDCESDHDARADDLAALAAVPVLSAEDAERNVQRVGLRVVYWDWMARQRRQRGSDG